MKYQEHASMRQRNAIVTQQQVYGLRVQVGFQAR